MLLRDYQKDIIDQTIASNKSTLIQVPTGGGKTVIAKEIALELVNRYKLQVLFIAPKIILMEQTAKVFKSLNPHIIHGINEYDKDHHILISTIQTASRRDINPDIIFVDEIHYGFTGKMLQKLIKDKSNTRIIGLSATPYDKNGNQLEGFNLVLDKYDLNYMVDNNYLVDIKPFVLTKIRKLDEVKVTAGDYNLKELSKVVSDNQTILEIVQSTSEYILKYKKTIVFAVDINHAELLTQAYQHEGFKVKVLHSKMSKYDIDRNIRLFRENQIKILVSVLMLTTGFDVPDTDVAIIARPTKSQNLYKQMVGRVLRIAENKKYAVLLDCANVIENLGMPLDAIKVIEINKNTTNKQKCKNCGNEKLSLKKDRDNFFWECKECGYKKELKRGAYACKMCNKLYTHDAKFEIKNNKLYLVCGTCPYPTLISEYSGDEKLVEIISLTKNEKLQDDSHKLIYLKSVIRNLLKKIDTATVTEKSRKKAMIKVKKDIINSLKSSLSNDMTLKKIYDLAFTILFRQIIGIETVVFLTYEELKYVSRVFTKNEILSIVSLAQTNKKKARDLFIETLNRYSK